MDKLHIDELDNSTIKAKNIIIQEAKTKVIDKEGRLSIELVGEGKGKYITNGRGIDIRWSKKSLGIVEHIIMMRREKSLNLIQV